MLLKQLLKEYLKENAEQSKKYPYEVRLNYKFSYIVIIFTNITQNVIKKESVFLKNVKNVLDEFNTNKIYTVDLSLITQKNDIISEFNIQILKLVMKETEWLYQNNIKYFINFNKGVSLCFKNKNDAIMFKLVKDKL